MQIQLWVFGIATVPPRNHRKHQTVHNIDCKPWLIIGVQIILKLTLPRKVTNYTPSTAISRHLYKYSCPPTPLSLEILLSVLVIATALLPAVDHSGGRKDCQVSGHLGLPIFGIFSELRDPSVLHQLPTFKTIQNTP